MLLRLALGEGAGMTLVRLVLLALCEVAVVVSLVRHRSSSRRGPQEPGYSPSSGYARRYSTQSKVLVTAFFQNPYSLARSAASIRGCHSLSLPQLARRSSTSFQKPTANPAAYAAPRDVVSATVGRITGTSRTSAWNCISVSL